MRRKTTLRDVSAQATDTLNSLIDSSPTVDIAQAVGYTPGCFLAVITIDGQSEKPIHPKLQDGDIVVVNPNEPPLRGDAVFIKKGTGYRLEAFKAGMKSEGVVMTSISPLRRIKL